MDKVTIAVMSLAFGGLLGAALNHFFTRDREKQSSKQFQRRTVMAIRSELESIIEINEQGITNMLRKVPNGRFLETNMEITQDYFTVFNSNCSQMGRIDEKLTDKIVRIYSLMKAMVDAYRINNNLLDTYRSDSLYQGPTFRSILVQQTIYLKEMDKAATKLIADAFILMDELGFKR